MMRAFQLEQQSLAWSKYLTEDDNLTLEAVETAATFARQAFDEKLSKISESLMIKLRKAEEYWQQAERSEAAVDWKLAAAACRSCRQARRAQDADARAKKAQARE